MTPLPTIKSIIKDNQVNFEYYRKGFLYYSIRDHWDAPRPKRQYLFPVPVSDAGEASFNRGDRAILFMRYIRQAMDEGTFVVQGYIRED